MWSSGSINTSLSGVVLDESNTKVGTGDDVLNSVVLVLSETLHSDLLKKVAALSQFLWPQLEH